MLISTSLCLLYRIIMVRVEEGHHGGGISIAKLVIVVGNLCKGKFSTYVGMRLA